MPASEKDIVPPRESSGVTFYPHAKYWRIGGKFYDLNNWLDSHPGGRQVLLLARDRYEDATFAFEAHHHDFEKVRAILSKYLVKDIVPSPHRLPNQTYPELCGADSFYSVLRKRVSKYLRQNGGPGPSSTTLLVFYVILVSWFSFMFLLYSTGILWFALFAAITGAWMGGFGHNWVHQMKYRHYSYCLDLLGLSSENWLRDHLLQHHMYTNTPLDNHFEGTSPFLIVDPTRKRSFLQAYVAPFIAPVFLMFGIPGNYVFQTVELFRGNERLTVGKFFLPIECALFYYGWGLYGLFLIFSMLALTSVYYFIIALANHNTESSWDIEKRNNCKDWGEVQLVAATDVGVGLGFYGSMLYLWLNLHTVHHLFPHVDITHHSAIQRILMDTCQEFGIKYSHSNIWSMYLEMVSTFHAPRHLGNQILYYAGG